MNTRPKIAILAPLSHWDHGYSHCSVIFDQFVMLKKYGYEVTFICLQRFKGKEDLEAQGIKVRDVLPVFTFRDYHLGMPVDEAFEKNAQDTQEVLEKELKDFTHVIAHDIIFQGWFLPYNVGLRRANVNVKWLHWVHSAPSLRPANLVYPYDHLYSIHRNERLVYLNDIDKIRIAEMYGIFPDDVRVVPNSIDPRTFWDLHPLTSSLIEKYGLLNADIVATYPLSSTRMHFDADYAEDISNGKNLMFAIRIIAELKKLGYSVRYVVANAHANAEKEKETIKIIRERATTLGLSPNELVFTSLEMAPAFENGVPRRVVSELFRLSNLFLFPSASENCSLVLLEAALSKNLLVLNESFLPLRAQLQSQALYFKFGAAGERLNYAESYFTDLAKIIASALKKEQSLNSFRKIAREFNLDTIFKKHLEPLFYE